MLNPAFWRLLAVNFYLFFENYGQEVGEDQYIVGPPPNSWGPVSPSPYGCCAYVSLLLLAKTIMHPAARSLCDS